MRIPAMVSAPRGRMDLPNGTIVHIVAYAIEASTCTIETDTGATVQGVPAQWLKRDSTKILRDVSAEVLREMPEEPRGKGGGVKYFVVDVVDGRFQGEILRIHTTEAASLVEAGEKVARAVAMLDPEDAESIQPDFDTHTCDGREYASWVEEDLYAFYVATDRLTALGAAMIDVAEEVGEDTIGDTQEE